MAELKTRIILRNGTTAEWADSTVLLKEGEIALEYCEDGTVKQKAGVTNEDGTGTLFKDLPYIGSDVKEAGIYEITYEFGVTQPIDIDDVATAAAGEDAEFQAGDILIIKTGLDSGKTKYSYTSYVYDTVVDGEAWRAMDGNYNAANVYFSNDITLAGSYTSVGNVSKSSNTATGTLSAAGKSLEDIMTSIFTKEINTDLQNTAPTTTINATKDIYLLVGADSTAQTVTLTLNKGKYDNGYGYVTEKNEENIAAGTAAVTVVTNDGTGVEPNQYYFNGTAQTTNSYSVASTKKTTAPSAETIKGKISYKNAGNPVSNLKKIYPAQAYADSTTSEVSATLNRWYLPFYHGFTVDADVVATPETVTAAQLQGLNKANMSVYRYSGETTDKTATTQITGADAYSKKKINTATAAGSWRQYFLAYPKDWGYAMSDAKDSNNLTCGVSQATDVTMTFNGVDVVYSVYYINNKAAYDTTKILWTI